MKIKPVYFIAAFVISMIVIQGVSAHVPVAGEPGESLETAVEIPDPTKSYVIYSELHDDGHSQYFTFEMEAGERLRTTLMIPTEYASQSFRPVLVLMGPGLANSSNISEHTTEHVEVPEGAGIILFDETAMHPEYEGFTPSSFYLLENVDIIIPESGVFYLAVYDEAAHGRYAITIGYRETFTLDEWLLVPFNVIAIHEWEGQNLALILAPLIIAVPVGLFLVQRNLTEEERISDTKIWIGLIGSLLIIGSGILIFYQMVWAALMVPANAQVLVTAIFGIIPVVLGYMGLQITLRLNSNLVMKDIAKLIIVGVISLFVWGGHIVGPVLIFIAGLISIIQIRQA